MATYPQIKQWVKETYGWSVQHDCWIAHCKDLAGLQPQPTWNRAQRGRAGWVGVGLNRKPDQSVTIDLMVTHLGGACAADYTGIPSSLTFSRYQKSKGFTVEAVSDSVAETGEQLRIAFVSLPSDVSAQSGQETATLEITDFDRGGYRRGIPDPH